MPDRRTETLTGPQYEGGRDVRIADAQGQGLWSRLHDIDAVRPYVCDRDGVARDSWDQIIHERKVGYA